MSFAQILRDVTQEVKGARGAVVVGMDGIVVEEYMDGPGIDLQSIGAEYGNILKEVQNASQSLQMGHTKEISVITEQNDLILRKISDDYFLAVVISPKGHFGKGRFAARKAANKLIKEL